jgi:ubiquitin-protein ligase
MSTQATARLQKELKDLNKNPVEGFKVELMDENNLYEWQVWMAGAPGTMWEGGIFRAGLKFPEDYPNSPPKMKFLSDFWHPNIYPDGTVCISILHTPDPMNPEERAEETWRPILTVESILVSVTSMLSDPNFSSPANVDASVECRKSPEIYKKKVLKLVEKSKKELPEGFEMPKAKKPVQEKEDTFEFFDDDYDMDEEEEDYIDDDDEEDEEGGEEDEEDEE